MIEKFKTNAEVIENGDKYLYGNHVRMPLSIERGEGAYVFDKDGNKYLDFIGGIAVNGLGHCHPAIVKCLEERAHTILHCSNYFYNEPAVQTAKLIVENSCFDKVLFANSGAEANEGQIKLARKYAKDHGHPERFVVITMKNSFHGRTLATCTATGQYAVHRYFEPLPSGFRYAEFNNLQSVKDIMDEYVCAILTEPVQGEGGVRPASQEFLQGLRDLCDEKGILLMFDEVQVGSGRTGKLFAHQNYGVEPDTCSMAKALGSGVPIGAVCARGEAAKTLTPGTHGSTFGGNPVACAAALAVIGTIRSQSLLERVQQLGSAWSRELAVVDGVNQVRGRGLLLGVGLDDGLPPAAEIAAALAARGFIVNAPRPDTIRLAPPFILSDDDARAFTTTLSEVLARALSEKAGS